MTFRLTRQAERDVIDIYFYTAEPFGLAQADTYHDKLEATFRVLAERPHIARERVEIDPPVRVHPFGSHIIIYTVAADENVLIVRVRHGSGDWVSDDGHITDD